MEQSLKEIGDMPPREFYAEYAKYLDGFTVGMEYPSMRDLYQWLLDGTVHDVGLSFCRELLSLPIPALEKQQRLFAVYCARQMQDFLVDPAGIQSIVVAERYAKGGASEQELASANRAAKRAAHRAMYGSTLMAYSAATATLVSDNPLRSIADIARTVAYCPGMPADTQERQFYELHRMGNIFEEQ